MRGTEGTGERAVQRIRLVSQSARQGEWDLELDAGGAVLQSTADEVLEVDWCDVPTVLEIVPVLREQTLLVVRVPRRKQLQFMLSPEQRTVIETWMAPHRPAFLRAALKRRYTLALPIAFAIVVTSLPLPANESAGIAAVPFDALGFIGGCGLAVLWLLARFRPSPSLFLLDSAWFAFLIVQILVDVFTNGHSAWWLVFAAFVAMFVVSGIRQYQWFSQTQAPAVALAEPGLE